MIAGNPRSSPGSSTLRASARWPYGFSEDEGRNLTPEPLGDGYFPFIISIYSASLRRPSKSGSRFIHS